jgi:acyl-coenzyme A thioesterase 13
MSDVPEGFREIARLSPFNALVGPLYERRAGRTLALGMRIEAKHSNSLSGFVTAQLSVDYAGAAKLGDWIESSVEVQRVGARLAFASGYIFARGERIVRASAIFARAGKEE